MDARFEILAVAGEGGMGTVYRAIDQASGAHVALKLLRDSAAGNAVRFAHEAKVLAGIEHPHVVRYVTHGATPEGDPYLVMEWLEGESLADRLAREGLRVEESMTLACHVASALGAAHVQGIVHRDIKPSNLFLVGGSIEQVKVLDFGIALLEEQSTVLTRTGSVLGTPGYIAPEQARGDRGQIDARADVFSLGCVLFECLTGRPAFQGRHVIALLAKLLMEEPPRVRELAPAVPRALEALVSRMLAKSPQDRPADGAAVAQALQSLQAVEGMLSTERPEPVDALTGTEKRLVSVVVVAPRSIEKTASPLAATIDPPAAQVTLAQLRKAVAPFGANLEELASGALVAMVVGAGHATDQAALAARCALRLRLFLPDAEMVLVTGRSEETRRLPVGELLERAATLMEQPDAQSSAAGRLPIRIDERTRALLDVRFDVIEQQGRSLLRAERMVAEEARTLLGKPSPFVGRDRELRNLVDLVEGSFEEERASAILVTAEAGMGKSRLRYELLRRLREKWSDLGTTVGRADSIAAGSAFGLLGNAIRSGLGIVAGEPLEAQQEKLAFITSVLVAPPERQRVAEFLGEMIGTPFPDEGRPMLKAARQNASIMAEQIEGAYLEIARAQASKQPTLLVFEDLHWGDGPSVKLLDTMLRELKHKPIVVLAFARPEVHERFPNLWTGRGVQEIRLRDLSRRAAESLVRSTLGDALDPAKVSAIVSRADGNAFYLEELIRTVAEGQGETWPETVLGMVEARLAALDPAARRLLRAASVFGEVFWKSGIPPMLGAEDAFNDKDSFAELVASEVLVRHATSRVAGEEEYAFRHALLREGAYAMLTERDRTVGHKLAGEWLERAGEPDSKLLAEHFDRGREGERAAKHYLRAAEQALDGGDFGATIRLAERGITLAEKAELLADLWALMGDAGSQRGDLERGLHAANESVKRARPGSRSDCRALATAILTALLLRRPQPAGSAMERLLRTDPEPDAIAPLAWGFYGAVMLLVYTAQRSQAEIYLRRLEHVASDAMGRDAVATGEVERVRANWARLVELDSWSALEHNRAAAAHFERAGDRHQIALAHVHVGFDLALLGQLDEQPLLRGIAGAKAASVPALLGEYYRASALMIQGRLDDAQGLAARVVKDAETRGEELIKANTRLTLAGVYVRKNEIGAAEREALALGETAAMLPYQATGHLTVLAEIRLRQGRAEEAADLAERVLSQLRAGGIIHHLWHAPLLLVRAEALNAANDREAAHAAIVEARADLLARATKIPDAEVRRGFLENLPTHARTLALARAWLQDP